jgi:hypothetical protein
MRVAGGAGGKGVWGKPGSELLEADLDMHDPNYDSDTLDNGDVQLKTIFPLLSDEELQVRNLSNFYKFRLVAMERLDSIRKLKFGLK